MHGEIFTPGFSVILLPASYLRFVVIGIEDFLVLRKQLPTVDVRSEGEFQQGHIPAAVNIPILNNAERAEVGTVYKSRGQAEAIKTGFRLVGPRLIHIIEAGEKAGKEFIVHCWRGGMRSANFCQFVSMAGIKTHVIKGGYKAYRQTVLQTFTKPFPLIVLSGSTGSGKSELLHALKRKGEQIIDLEMLASHKGSVFGGLTMPPQPTTEQFQNDLFEEILALDLNRRIWIEDESIAVGRIFLPEPLWRQMCSSPLVEVTVPKDVRISRLAAEYASAEASLFLDAMERITKKLGGQHFNAAREKYLQKDLAGTIDLLLNYYDKAYANGLQRKKDRIKLTLPWNGLEIEEFAAQLIREANIHRVV